MKKFKFISVFFVLLFLPLFFLQANSVSPPVVSDLNSSLKNFSEPFISGFTEKNTNVLVYIDGNYWADATIVDSNNRANFYFFLNKLPKEGKHSFFLIARDLNGVMSSPTNEFDFYISHRLDTPLLIKSEFMPSVLVVGESENENFIDVVLDDKIDSTIFIEKNEENIFKFENNTLSQGNHSIYFLARDAVGRISLASQKLEFILPKKQQAQIKIPPEEQSSGKTTIEKNTEGLNIPLISTFGESEAVIVEGVDNINLSPGLSDEQKIIDDILSDLDNNVDDQTGALNESGDSQSDLRLNIFIFLGFLVAVILWIIWVNRELKENEKEETTGSDK